MQQTLNFQDITDIYFKLINWKAIAQLEKQDSYGTQKKYMQPIDND